MIAAALAVFIGIGVLASRFPSAAEPPTTRTSTTSTSAQPDAAARLGAIQRSAERLRGVTLGHPVSVTHIDRTAVTALVTRLSADGADQRQVQTTDEALHLMGALPTDRHLQEIMTSGLSAQVAGLYDPGTKQLYVVDGTKAPATDSTLLHEVVHAIQDSRYDLEGTAFASRPRDADGQAAAQSVAEGDATEVQTRYLESQGLSGVIGELGGSLSQLSEVPADERQLPPFAQRSFEFPYLQGAKFVAALRTSGGEAAVDRAFRTPPKSTLSILIPQRYLAGDKPPVTVALPRPDRGAQRVLSTTFGASDLLALGVSEDIARTWRGGKIALDHLARRGIVTIVISTTRPGLMATAMTTALPKSARIRVERASISVRIAG